MRAIGTLLGLVLMTSLHAEEQPLKIETDLEVNYFLVSRGGSPEQQILLLKRVRPDGSAVYSKRLFDCEAGSYQKLGSWESLEAIAAACPANGMHPIEEGTIAYQLWQYACGVQGMETQPAAQSIVASPSE
ncbi:MAG: hypothetical protein PVG22_17730 [Chromatiales bacterium]